MFKEKTTYSEMIEFCCDNLILNNSILNELSKNGYYFDFYCGTDVYYTNDEGDEISYEEYEENGGEEYYADIYQYYLISERDAERLSEYTNEIVLYNDDLELYLLCVTHCGTAWCGVPANWKKEALEND